MKLFNLLLAIFCCSSLLAQNLAKLPQNEGSLILRDSTVRFADNKRESKTVYTYDEAGRETSEVEYHYPGTGIIWEGEQSCNKWDGVSLRFSDCEGKLPTISDATYESMIGKTLHLDIKEVAGEGTIIRVTDGWWSEIYVPDAEVHAGETFSFEFTKQMADNMKNGGGGRDLLFTSNNGLTITKLYFDVDLVGNPRVKREYKYDASGNNAGYAEYTWKNGDWGITSLDEDLFDENGCEIGFVTMQMDFGVKYEYVFDADGVEIGYLHYELKDGEWTLQSKTEYTYDANGYVTEGITSVLEDGEWVVSSKIERTFDAKGRVIANVEYEFSDGVWVKSYKYEYAYDDNDHEILNVSYTWRGEWTGSTKTERAYDDEDHEILRTSYYWRDGEWIYSYKYENTYDDHGNHTYSAWFNGLDGEWIFSSANKYEYTYDANGNVICQIEYYSWQYDEWEEAYKYEYTYDEDDNLTRGESFAKTYNGWEPMKTDIHYYSDHHANCIEQLEAKSRNAIRKVMKDGKILIMKDGHIYNVQGQQFEMK